jgi:hypothetical protein
MDMHADEQKVHKLVRDMYEQAEATPWDLTPESIRARSRHRAIPLPDPKVLALIAAAVVLIALGLIFLRPTTHRTSSTVQSTTTTTAPGKTIVVPNVIGLDEAQAEAALGDAGLNVGAVTSTPSTTFAAGSVIGSNPHAGAAVASSASVSLTVSSGPPGSTSANVPSTTSIAHQAPSGRSESTAPISQANCPTGNRSITVAAASASTCIRTGAKLTVTFQSLGWWSGYGSWANAAPMISNGSVLEGISWAPSAKMATAVFAGWTPGSSVVTAQFNVSCAPTATTPCTVPPEAPETITVTVAGA